MLKLEDFERKKRVIQSQNQVGVYSNYVKAVLEPAIARGDWDELEQMPIGFDDNGNPLGYFKDDEWKLTQYFYPNINKKSLNIIFTVDGTVLERNLKNQIKCLILKMLWISPRYYSLEVCMLSVTMLKKYALILLEDGDNSFSHLSFERIEEWVFSGVETLDFKAPRTYGTVNKLFFEKAGLPFNVALSNTISPGDFGLKRNENKQYLVIPFRIYSQILNKCTDSVHEVYADRLKLRELARHVANIPETYAKHI